MRLPPSSFRSLGNNIMSKFTVLMVVLFLALASSVQANKKSNTRRSMPMMGSTTTAGRNLSLHTSRKQQHESPINSTRGGAAIAIAMPPDGTSTMTSAVFNIVKSIVGAGVLGIPAGIAAFGNHPSALLPASILLLSIGCMAAVGFLHIGTVCETTKATSYQEAWSRSVSPSTAWIPTTACTLVTTFAVLCYSMILADTIPSLLATASSSMTFARTPTLITFTITVLLPLCLLRTLSKLAPFSLVGILGMVYTSGVMMIRYATGAYTTTGQSSGVNPLAKAAAFAPHFGDQGWKSVFSPSSAILVSMLSTAYMAHYNAPRFLWELETRSQFPAVVWISFATAMVLMLCTAVAGFGTFGGNSQGLILNNYAPTDVFMGCSRAAVTLSLLFSYPLAFSGVREGWMQLLRVPTQLTDVTTIVLLTGITGAALVLKDIRVIMAFSGAAFGNLLVYVFPAIMIRGAAQQHPELQKKVPLAIVTGIMGVIMGVVGTAQAVQSLYE